MAALVFGAVFLLGCERAAELIPGEGTPTPTPTAPPMQTPTATPITVNPGADGSAGAATGGQVIADHELALSVVQVVVADRSGGFEQIIRYGSGVVLDAEAGLIATAYPVVHPYRPDGTRAYTHLVIATNRVPGTEPQREYLAELVASDPGIDLAILRVVSDLDGEPLVADSLDVPQVIQGDATAAGAGFSLRLFGHPGVRPDETSPGSQVIETATATIQGQRGASNRTGRTWFKMDGRMPFGAAGGPAFDRFGALVGFLAQDQYVPSGTIGQIRPLDLVTPLLEEARDVSGYRAPLYRTATLPGSLDLPPASPAYVSRPAFAENAIESAQGRDLFDYETRFAEGLGALYYEYEVSGVADGSVVEERWFLDGVQQESLSSSYVWSDGLFGHVTDRITAPGTTGIPSGRWRLDVYVGDIRHATATAIVGVSLGTPSAIYQAAASSVTLEGNVSVGAFSGAEQLLLLFDLSGMSGAELVEWSLFLDNRPIYTTAAIPWTAGEAGRFWIGYVPEGGLGPGLWEVELRVDGVILAVGSITLF